MTTETLARTRHPAGRALRADGPGERLRRAESRRRPSSGFVLLAVLTAVLLLVGLVMVLSASYVGALHDYGTPWYFFERQALWVAIGCAALCVSASFDYHRWSRLAVPLTVLTAGLLILVMVPHVGISVNGSTRWLGFGSWRLQPSEVAKLGLLIAASAVLARRADSIGEPRLTLTPVMWLTVPVLVLVMAQPDMGTAIVIGFIVAALLFSGGVRGLSLLKLAGVATAGGFLLALAEPYRRDRLLSFLHPWKDAGGTGYQAIQGRIALAEGKLLGVGLGASRAKWDFLPNAHTDFIVAIIGEELGLVGTLLVVALFACFAFLGIRAALRAPDHFGMLLATGITAWVVGQALLNIGAVIGVLPITGVPLPFVSFGGTSLVVLLFAVGILLNVARQSR